MKSTLFTTLCLLALISSVSARVQQDPYGSSGLPTRDRDSEVPTPFVTYQGTFVGVDADKHLLKVRMDTRGRTRDLVFRFNERTKVRGDKKIYGKKDLDWSDVKEGDQLNIEADRHEPRLATEIRVKPAKKAS